MKQSCFQCPCPCGGSLPNHASTGTLQHWLVVLFQAPVESLLLSCILGNARFCLCPPRLGSLFLPVLWKSSNQILLAFKVRFPGDAQFLCQVLQAGKPDMGFRTFTTGELLWCYCSPVCGSPTWRVWDLILSWLPPPTCLLWLLCFWIWGIFFFFFLMDSSVLLTKIIQQLVVILVLSQEEMSACPSTLPSWTSP